MGSNQIWIKFKWAGFSGGLEVTNGTVTFISYAQAAFSPESANPVRGMKEAINKALAKNGFPEFYKLSEETQK